ncbi:MAG: hypothetical protein A3H97_06140 [Acidobacteria bacterium RIFCSPLOWO2_02_FULL_65_29]|nr:MAG: hypothetical protein A3H97_06140 [Acidobacteria bacterium RIFCSPLOWO2_02_FULL_65_29]
MENVATPTAQETGTATGASKGKGLGARALGVIFSPRETYLDIAAHPRVVGALVVVLLITIVAQTTFLMTDVGKDALFDQQIRGMESFGFRITDQMYDRMEQGLAYTPYTGAALTLVMFPVVWAAISGLILGVFNLALGGEATFRQAYAVVAHSAFLVALQQVFVTPLNYARQSMSSPTTLGVFFPFLDEATFLARLLGGLDLFFIWLAVNLAIGVGVLYKRTTTPIAIAMLGLYLGVVLIIVAIRTAFGGP